MKYFQTQTCPLCSKKLKVGDEETPHNLYCEWFLTLDDQFSLSVGLRPPIKNPHYAGLLFA